MGLREDLLRRIERKRQEIAESKALEAARIAGEERYLQGMLDTFKLIPRDGLSANGSAPHSLRKGGSTAKAYAVLKREGHAIHIKDLVEATGKKATRVNRSSLSSSLSAYARKGEIFTKPAPNTFGLVEFGASVEIGDSASPDLSGEPED